MSILKKILWTSLLAGLAFDLCSAAQIEAFSNWPAGASPQEVGKRVAENFLARKFQCMDPKYEARRKYVIYPEICAWYGSLTVAKLTNDAELQKKLIGKFDVLLTEEGARKISQQGHVDFRIFGVAPLEVYIQTKDARFRELGLHFADAQWEKATADGITVEARYWIDDMYMSPILQAQAFRATGDVKYLDRAALMTAAYLDKLQQPNALFLHAPDSPFYWGRGNGWVAAGMTELLRDLPVDNPKRARILEGYTKMMEALLKTQGEDGLWKQLIDKPESWSESSCTGMFAFAMVTGVKNGWLDEKTYAPAARKAWLALVRDIDADANIKDVCEGTNKSGREVGSDMDAQYKFYMERKRLTGDLHGQSPVLWTASALMR